MSKDLIFALNARAALTQMRSRMVKEVHGVTPEYAQQLYLTDIPAELAVTLPDDLSDAFPPELLGLAKSLLSDDKALEQLFSNFQKIAGRGVVPGMMTRPGEE